MANLNIELTKSQLAFLELKCCFPAYIGGLGAGKTFMLGLKAVIDAQHSHEALVGIYAPTWDLINAVSLPSIEYWLNQFGYQRYKDYTVTQSPQKYQITSHNKRLGDFKFKTLNSPDTIIGYQTSSAHVDELDTLPTKEAEYVWSKIVERNRKQLTDAPKDLYKWSELHGRDEYINVCNAYTSPEGFKFCYQRWGNDNDPNYQCVHADTRDNPAMSEAYISSRTRNMSKGQIEAYIEGKFVNFNNSSTYYNYNREVCRSFETIQPKESLRIGCDFNVGKTCATVYVTRDGGRVWHAVDEIWGELDAKTLGRTIYNRYTVKGHYVIIYPDSSGKGRSNANASITSLNMLREYGFELRHPSKNILVKDRVACMNNALEKGKVKINDSLCIETARCLEQQANNEDGEPIKDGILDHQNDSTTYPICYEMPISPPIESLSIGLARRGSICL